MRVALDATYSVDPRPSGIGVYSTEILNGLARLFPEDQFVRCYRLKQFQRAKLLSPEPRRLLLPPFPTFRADLFHALNQRVDHRPTGTVVSTFHDLFVMTGDYSSPEFRARFTNQAKTAAANSDLIIAVSQFTADQVVNLLGFDSSRIRVIPHGVHRPEKLSPQPREKLVLFVGTLQARKNVVRLVDAFRCAPLDWQLVLAGSATGYKADELLARIEQNPARKRITVTGYISRTELERLYAKASIFAFPSLDEGFGIPALEAMAFAVPVITSRSSALQELANGIGLLVDPSDTEELIAALNRLMRDPELRKEMGAKGRAHSLRFSWENAVRLTHSAYCEALVL